MKEITVDLLASECHTHTHTHVLSILPLPPSARTVVSLQFVGFDKSPQIIRLAAFGLALVQTF